MGSITIGKGQIRRVTGLGGCGGQKSLLGGDVSVMVKDVLGLALRGGGRKTNHGPSEDREGGVVRKNVRRTMRFH